MALGFFDRHPLVKPLALPIVAGMAVGALVEQATWYPSQVFIYAPLAAAAVAVFAFACYLGNKVYAPFQKAHEERLAQGECAVRPSVGGLALGGTAALFGFVMSTHVYRDIHIARHVINGAVLSAAALILVIIASFFTALMLSVLKSTPHSEEGTNQQEHQSLVST